MDDVDDVDDEADAVLAVRCGIGMSVGNGEDGAGDNDDGKKSDEGLVHSEGCARGLSLG